MLFKSTAVITLTAATLTLGACGSTQTRTDSPSGSTNAMTSDESVYASQATMRVDGLGCPMCAESISLVLGSVEAVESSHVDLSNGIVTVDLNPRVAVTSRQLRSAIDDGGFTFRSVEFTK
ncbi:MAG: heavy-metal-associated domain-containing protein [Phycisphaerales bacterium]|nr:heavy-metal-associated domain-containing protein [Phycisphaerales bacterium]